MKRIKEFLSRIRKRREKEYSKRMLTLIVVNSIGMMWASYLLAFIDKADIAEALSKTIASAIIAVVIVYFAKATLENISKNTTAFGENVPQIPLAEDDNERQRDC